MHHRQLMPLALATVALLGLGAAVVADATEPPTELRLRLEKDGVRESLEVVDLDAMTPGESRSLTTDAGRPVTVTRAADGWDVEVDGRTLHVDVPAVPDVDGAMQLVRKQRVVDGSGERHESVIVLSGESDEEDGDVRVVHRVGPGGAHAYAFGWQTRSVDELIERLESSEQFLALDAATRATVVDAIRNAAPEPGARRVVVDKVGPDEAGDGPRRVIVLDLVDRPDADDQD